MSIFSRNKVMLAFVLCVVSHSANAKEVSFTCQAEQPYDMVAFKQRGAGDVIVTRRHGGDDKIVSLKKGRLSEVVTPAHSKGNAVALPLEVDGTPRVSLLLGSEYVAELPGRFYHLSGAPGNDTYLLTTYQEVGKTSMGHQILASRRDGVLGERSGPLTLEEGVMPRYELSEDGRGMYMRPDPNYGSAAIDVWAADGSFRKLTSSHIEGISFIDVVMMSPNRGFALAGGQIFYLDNGRFRVLSASTDTFYAQAMEIDSRAGRLLVKGNGGYAVYLLDGTRVFSSKAYATRGRAFTPAVKLAIDGSIGEFSENKLIFRDKAQAYQSVRTHSMPFKQWRDSACFTANSIAYRDQDGTLKMRRFTTP